MGIAIEAALRFERYARHSDRIKCILLLDAGDPPEDIAYYLFLSLTTVNNYLKRYQSGGLSELIQDNHLGSECRLTECDLNHLSSHLEENLYQTIAAIREYVLSRYRVYYTESGMRHLLNRLGFTPNSVRNWAKQQIPKHFKRICQAEGLTRKQQILSCFGI
jgi:transposase